MNESQKNIFIDRYIVSSTYIVHDAMTRDSQKTLYITNQPTVWPPPTDLYHRETATCSSGKACYTQ